MDLHEVYTVWDKPSSVHPRCAPLAWSVAPPASVPVYCPLFSNLTLVIFVWLIILSGPYLPAWKPESLASLEQSLIKHWSDRTSCWKWLVSLSSNRRFWQQKHRMPLCPHHDLQMWSILASDSLPCTTVLFSPQVVTKGQFHWAPSTPSVRALWLPALWRLLQSHRLPDASFVLGPMLSTGGKVEENTALDLLAPSQLHQFSKAASQSCVSQNVWWEMGRYLWGPQEVWGAGRVQAEKLAFVWKGLIQKKSQGTHRQVDSYIGVLNMWILQSLLSSSCLAHDSLCLLKWPEGSRSYRFLFPSTRCLTCYDIR